MFNLHQLVKLSKVSENQKWYSIPELDKKRSFIGKIGEIVDILDDKYLGKNSFKYFIRFDNTFEIFADSDELSLPDIKLK